MKKRLNLMSKLMLFALIVIILPISTVGFYSYNNSKNALKNEAESTIKAVLDGTEAKITLKMDEIEGLGSILSNLPTIVNYSDEVYKGEVDENTLRLVDKLLKDFEKNISDITESIFITDKNGKVVVDNMNDSENGVDLSHREYFKESILGKKHWNDVVMSVTKNKPIVVYSVPLKSSNGDIVGIIGIAIKFNSISDVVAQANMGETGYACLINKNGTILYHPKEEKILKENLLDTENTVLREQTNKMLNGEEGLGFYNYEGVYKLNMYKPVGNWSLAVNISVDEYMKPAIDIRNNTLRVTLIAILLGTLFAFFIAKQIVNPVKHLMELMAKAEKGDLTVISSVKTKDEIGALGNSFNHMIKEQNKAMTDVITVTNQVANASEETSSASEEMAASSEEQSASVQEFTDAMHEMSRSIAEVASNANEMSENINTVNHSMEELGKTANEVANSTEETAQEIVEVTSSLGQMNASIALIADNSKNANKEAEKTAEVGKEGKLAIDNTISEMDNINGVMKNLTQFIKGLGKAAIEIGDIVEVIDDIAEQTNLLSLNASIEAARAGEHGKGFAVVAGAIGSLAEKSSEATKDITKLIKNIQEEVQNAVYKTDEGAKQVENGANLVKNTGIALDKIFEAINNTNRLINEIASSTEEQTEASKAIMVAIEKVNDFSMQVSASVEEQVVSIDEVILSVEKLSSLSEGVASSTEEQSAASEELLATAESINEMTNEVSTGSEELATTAESLAHQAETLSEVVSKFKIS